MAYDYFRSGADDERTLRENERAFRRSRLWPRMLVDVARCETGIELLGSRLAFPVLTAPMAYQKLAHPDGEVAMARAAAAAGTIAVVATLATTSLEEIAAATPAPKWFQLYAQRDRGVTRTLVERAAAAGYQAIMLTVDAPVLGRRLADVRNGFGLPPGLAMENLRVAGGEGLTLAQHVLSRHDASMEWRDLEWLRGLAPVPLVLKGVLRRDDAVRAIACGAAAILVSNHGGRQLDGTPASLDALPGVIEAVAGRVPVLMDGGVRSGGDVLKALALGATAVLVGRPLLWGLAVGGEEGALRVLALLRGDLERAMQLAGCATIGAVTRDLVELRA
jgi:4-hydroxymandelate oxidase